MVVSTFGFWYQRNADRSWHHYYRQNLPLNRGC
ncbi:MAG: glycosyltransferase family 29 protein [Chroococcus sp. CMT-3BRIN-NPC107]|nr:glycosyltransferase family 29 protein [Chroococcus sp. CMT-3BRIN-NPC107]